jgi:hypothetical protein
MPEARMCAALPKFRIFSLIRSLFQHIRIIAEPIGTFIVIKWGFLQSVHDVFVNTIDLMIGPLIDTPLKSLHAFGLIWTGGGILLMFLAALVANFRVRSALPPVAILLLISWILVCSLSGPRFLGAYWVIFLQIPAWLAFLGFRQDSYWVACTVLCTNFILPAGNFVIGLTGAVNVNLLAGAAITLIGGVTYVVWGSWMVSLLVNRCCPDTETIECDIDEFRWEAPEGALQRGHIVFWSVWVISIAAVVVVAITCPLAVVIVVLVIFFVPVLVKAVESSLRTCVCLDATQAEVFVLHRRLFVARMFGMALFFVLQQMNVPLAQFFLDAVFQADIDLYFRVMLTLIMVGIHVFAVLAFNIVMIHDFSGNENEYMNLLNNVQTAATSNYESYQYQYRYWIVLETVYDLLNSLLINIGSRGYPYVYWANVGCHIIYTYLHAVLRPSLHGIHNFVETSVGVSQVLDDIAVLESIYGSGSLSWNGVWTFLCALIPVATGAVEWIHEKFCEPAEEESEEDEVSFKARRDIENQMLNTVFVFLGVGTGGGLVFINLVSVVGLEEPPGYWWGVYIVVPLATLALYAIFPIFISRRRVDFGRCCMNAVEFCGKAVCWCRSIQIAPELPSQ